MIEGARCGRWAAWLGLVSAACSYGPKTVVGEVPSQISSSVVALPITYTSIGVDGATISDLSMSCSNAISSATFLGDPCEKDTSDDFEILHGGAVAWEVDCSSKLDPERRPAVHLVCTYRPESTTVGAMTLALSASTTEALRGMFLGTRAWSVDALASNRKDWPWSAETGEPRFVVRRARAPEGSAPQETEPALILSTKADDGVVRTTAFVAPKLSTEERAELTALIFTLMHMRDARSYHSVGFPGDERSGRFRLDLVDGKVGLRPPDTLEGADECRYTESEETPLPSPGPEMDAHAEHALQILGAGYPDAARALWFVLDR